MTVEGSIITTLVGHDKKSNCSNSVKTFDFELYIIDEPVTFSIRVENTEAKLSDIVPLARTLSTKLALITLDKLRKNGGFVPCRKGCSACCTYFVPLSVPEVFRLREEIMAMPASQGTAILQSSLEMAKKILNAKPQKLYTNKPTKTENPIQIKRLSKWYAKLQLTCPFLSDNLCSFYSQRPIACREHIITGTEKACRAEWMGGSQIVQMPISILDCLGQLTTELEMANDIEAVMLPFAIPWAQENLERNNRTWPAIFMVERFIEILKVATPKNLTTTSSIYN